MNFPPFCTDCTVLAYTGANMGERDGFMDEYRGRHQGYDRGEPHHHHEEPVHCHAEPGGSVGGILPGLGIGGDFLEEYLPIILIILGAIGVYLLLGKNNNGLGGILGGLGGFFK